MDYLSDILNTKISFASFGRGLIMFKTRLFLNVSTIKQGQIDTVDVQKDKRDTFEVSPETKVSSHLNQEVANLLGEPYVPRRATNCQSLGTIYGMGQKWNMGFTQQSITGMNRTYLDEEGRPNAQAILKRLREIAPDVELKEQRLNLLLNKTVTNDFYDNSTALLVLLLREYHLAKFFEKNDKFDFTFSLKATDYEGIRSKDEVDRVRRFSQFLSKHDEGAGTTEFDLNHYGLLEKIESWYSKLPAKYIKDKNGLEINNPDYFSANYELQFKVWHMYDYDDGHSRSGSHFGDHFGFKNNKFIIPTRRFTMDSEEIAVIKDLVHHMPMNEAEIRSYSTSKGYINLTGVSSKEKTFLNYVFNSPRRQTPFLVDQYLDLNLDVGDISAYQAPPDMIGSFEVSSQFIMSLITKLVNIHRWHEDMLSACRALRYWIAQPATETVESHWWTHLDRTLVLPRLGMRRALFGFLLEGEGVSLTHDGHKMYRQLMAKNDCMIAESLFANTCWYWGEYLLVHNAPNLNTILERLYLDTDQVLRPQDRADAIYGAMIGRAIPTSQYLEQVTYLRDGISECKKKFIPFGPIRLDGEADYGYTFDHDRKRVNLRTLVAPSCVALITGLNGKLLQNTPYSSVFSINTAVRKVYQGRRKYGYNYNDLWAVGVVNRWQGFDTKYFHPKRSGIHRIFAANSVSVAMPPVTPSTLDEASSYTIDRIVSRDHCFGTGYDRLYNCQSVYTWNRIEVLAQVRPEFGAESSGTEDVESHMVKYYKTSTYENQTYKTHLISDYDFKLSDFQIDRTVLAVPLPSQPGLLQLPELTELPDPEPDPPGLG